MAESDDSPMTEKERAHATRGADLIARAVAAPEAQAPSRLREALERQRAVKGRGGVARGGDGWSAWSAPLPPP